MPSEYEIAHLAWDAYNAARERVRITDLVHGTRYWVQEWQARGAPSVGARAAALLRQRCVPDRELQATLAELALYLSDEQKSERPGFYKPRKSMGPQVLPSWMQTYG